jgi:hypothetical protein
MLTRVCACVSASWLCAVAAFESNLHCLTFTIFQVTATMEWIASDNLIAKQSGAGGSSSSSSHWEDRPIMSAVAARCEDFAACAATTIVRYSASAGARAAQSPGAKSGSYTTASSMYIFLDKVCSWPDASLSALSTCLPQPSAGTCHL